MPRNEFWTASDAAAAKATSAWISPDGTLGMAPVDLARLTFDTIGSISGSFTSGETSDYIIVNMVAGAKYNFIATGSYQVSLVIYDNAGYLMAFTDPDDIGVPDPYPQDSIVKFVAEYTGEYRLRIYYSNLTGSTGSYIIAGSADYGANDRNDAISTGISKAVSSLLYGSNATLGTTISTDVYGGKYNYSTAIALVVNEADASTSVATLAYEFFTGKIPGQAGVEYLVSATGPNPNNLNSAYYKSFNLENRYINFSVNLGKVGEGSAKFSADYGSLTLFDATRKAYAAIFGAAPTDTKIHALIDSRVDYFATYGGDGANGIGTKAAMVGWLLAEAAKADLGVMVRSNSAWLTDLADGSAPFAIDIIDPSKGYYKAEFVYGG